MKRTTRIILIIICILLIILSAVGVIWAFVNKFSNKAYAEELEQTTFVNFNQYVSDQYTHNATLNSEHNFIVSHLLSQEHYFYVKIDVPNNNTIRYESRFRNYSGNISINLFSGNRTTDFEGIIQLNTNANYEYLTIYAYQSNFKLDNAWCIDLTQMFGSESANTMTLEQCQQLFKADYYPYNTGTAIDLSGFEQYNAGAMSIRESMTINTTSANIAENLDNVVINNSYGSTSKALIQGFMVWSAADNYANCTAIFNLQTNFNKDDYFEFEFYTITGADTLNLPNQSFTMDLQIIAVDSSGSIVPLTTIKAQNDTTTPTKATFYLPFDTDKLYITTPHKYIVGYNNFNINITTTNLTALSLYSYQDGYRSGRSSGYTAGYNKGLSETNATLGTMEYVGAAFGGIGEILQIELLPGVPFSLFILLPLMFGLIAFVVKLSKGGS